MQIQPEGILIENLNPSSVVNAENVDLPKLLISNRRTRNQPDIRHR